MKTLEERVEQELEKRGIADYSLDQAQNAVRIGWMSQDDYNLFYDSWMTMAYHFSTTNSDVALARKRLEERFS